MEQRVTVSHLNAAYRKAEIADGYASIPDGIYKALIKRASIRRAQSGTIYIAWELDVALSLEETVTIQKTTYLSEKAFPMFKRDLKAVDVDPDIVEPFERIYDVLEFLSGAVVEFEQRTRPNENDPSRPYVNQNFQRLIRESGKTLPVYEAPPVDEGFKQVDDDDLPF